MIIKALLSRVSIKVGMRGKRKTVLDMVTEHSITNRAVNMPASGKTTVWMVVAPCTTIIREWPTRDSGNRIAYGATVSFTMNNRKD
jgi:hypothetical protein